MSWLKYNAEAFKDFCLGIVIQTVEMQCNAVFLYPYLSDQHAKYKEPATGAAEGN